VKPTLIILCAFVFDKEVMSSSLEGFIHVALSVRVRVSDGHIRCLCRLYFSM